jgi:hypothetical protein
MMLRASAPTPQALQVTPHPTVRLDQISCLDLNGSPVAAPRLDTGQILLKDMRSQPDNCSNGIVDPMGNQSLISPPPLGTLSSQSGIPFTMYSTGNLVTMPLTQHSYIPHSSSLDTNFSSKTHTGAIVMPTRYASKGEVENSGAAQRQEYRNNHNTPANTGTIALSTMPIYPTILSSHSGTARRANCLICAMSHTGANAAHPGYQSQGLPLQSFGHHNHRQDYPLTGFQASGVAALTMHHTGGIDKSSAMPPPPSPAAYAPQQANQLSSRPTPAPEPAQKKRHAQNLLVDVAETVEAVFPYAEVATRHGVAPSKVAEALAGVVLLPLLRCATDKRRAGQLAQERMREYRDVKQGTSTNRGTPLRVGELAQVMDSSGNSQAAGG